MFSDVDEFRMFQPYIVDNIRPFFNNIIQIMSVDYVRGVNLGKQSNDFIDEFGFFGAVFDKRFFLSGNVFFDNGNRDC